MISWCGRRPAWRPFSESLRRCCTPKRCCSSTMTSASPANSMPSWKSAWVPTTTRTSPAAIAASALRRVRAGTLPDSSATVSPSGANHAWKLRQCCSAKQLSGRHERGLQAAAGRRRRRRRGHHRLAAADIPLQQADHRHAAGEIAPRLLQRARLRARQREGQRAEEALREAARIGERRRGIGLQRPPPQLQRQVMRQQLLEGEAPLRRVPSARQLRESRCARRRVHVGERLRQRRQSGRQSHRRRQQVGQLRAGRRGERRAHQRAQPPLRYALGGGIDGREGVFERGRLALEAAVFRVHHLQAERPAPHFTEAAQPRAARELLLLAGGKIEEAQRQQAGAVGDARQQLAPPAVSDLGELDLPFDRRARAGDERADPLQPRAVLVAQRQQEQQVRHVRHAELRQPRGECRAHAAQRRHRPPGRAARRRRCQGARGARHAGSLSRPRCGGATRPPQPRCRMHSISTCAPRGSCATPIVERAG